MTRLFFENATNIFNLLSVDTWNCKCKFAYNHQYHYFKKYMKHKVEFSVVINQQIRCYIIGPASRMELTP